MKERDEHTRHPGEFLADEFGRVAGFARGRFEAGGESDFEDVVQDVALTLFERADLHAPLERLAGYVFRAVRNRIVDLYRRRKLRRAVSLDQPAGDGGGTLGEVLPDPGAQVEDVAARTELRARLVAALERLSPAQRAVWLATEVEGYTFRELSELWGVPVGTLLARKHRAVWRLQKLMAEYRDQLDINTSR